MKPPIWLWFLLPLLALLWSAREVALGFAQYQRARAEVRALERQAEALAKALPQALAEAPVQERELPFLYEALLRLAEREGLTLKGLVPGQAEAVGEVRSWRVELGLEGPYPGVLAFLNRLPEAGKPLWVERYRLEPVEGTQGERLALDLVLRVLAP